MISKNEVRSRNPEVRAQMQTAVSLATARCQLPTKKLGVLAVLGIVFIALTTGCYSFKDVSIPPEIKTFRVNYIENKARYINPQLSPQLTDKLRQKINGQTRLTGVQTDNAHYDISGQVTGYTVTTSAISNQQAAGQRLTVTIHINLKNTLDPSKNFEADVSRNFDYSAGLSLTAAEAQLTDNIVKQMTDEIFNRIFSNW